MKILASTPNLINNSQLQNNKKQSFGMKFDFPENVIQEAEHYATNTYFNEKETRKFLANLMEDIISHNKKPENHYVYDEVRKITDVRIWDGYYQVKIKNNEPNSCYDFSFDIKETDDGYILKGNKKKTVIDNFGDFFQKYLENYKYSNLNPNASNNLKKLESKLQESLA